jgi:2-dehydro-3-deoxyphosphogluconate aldolase/(4S)-4-hydroxy-2-oxoglutarate aldolase
MNVLSALSAARLVPVVVLDDTADADALAGALVAGGLPVAEVTFRTAAAADSIRAMTASILASTRRRPASPSRA